MPSYARAHQVTRHAGNPPTLHSLSPCVASVPGIEWPRCRDRASPNASTTHGTTSAPQSQSQNAILAFNWPWKRAGLAMRPNTAYQTGRLFGVVFQL